MSAPHVTMALFCVPMWGHMQRMLPLIAGLTARGCIVHAFTHVSFREHVERAGGHFRDLDGPHPMDAVDTETLPLGCRQLSYAAAYTLPLREQLAALKPALILHDAFAVIGAALGRLMGIPTVTVPAGHNRNVRSIPDVLRTAPGIHIGATCRDAMETLADWGAPDVTPFLYLTWYSRDLNVYCEPPEYLQPEERAPFEPLEFFGSIWPARHEAAALATPPWPARRNGRRRAYVSLGTMAWRYFTPEMLAALDLLAGTLVGRDCEVLISLGGREDVADAARRLQREHVRVETWVDQWAALRDADLCVIHHGLNSTHEAAWHQVPMLSLPLFADQPHLARRCQELGLAVPLVRGARFPRGAEDIHAALAQLADAETPMRARLAVARRWEEDVIARREHVLDRIIDLARSAG